MALNLRHVLPNGLKVVAESIPHVRSIALGIWIATGSVNETERENGMSHFIEHMLFKGTGSRSAREIAEAFDEIGGQVNAFTSKEMTCYYVKVLDQHFQTSLHILADMFFDSKFLDTEISKEKKVIVEEIRMVEDTPDDLIHDLLAEASFGTDSLSYPVLGSVQNVESFTRDELVHYRNQYYLPDNVVIAAAGNLPSDFLEQIEAIFSQHEGVYEAEKRSIPTFISGRKGKEKPTEQTHICLGLPGLSVSDEDIYTVVLINNILGGNMSSRLFQEIREEHGLAYSVYSYHSAYRNAGLFAVYAGTAHGQEEEVVKRIQGCLGEVCVRGFYETELLKAKEQLKASLMLGLESTNSRMSRLGRNELLLGKHLSLDDMLHRIESISLSHMNQLAQSIFSQPMSLAMISPTGRILDNFGGNGFA